MALNIENNVEFEIGAGLTSGTLLLTVKAGKEALLPVVPFELTLVKFNTAGIVTQREIVNVTAKATNVLTIERAYEAVPVNDSATTAVQVAYDWEEGDMAYMTLTAKIFKDIFATVAGKLDKTGGAMSGLLSEAIGADIASAATTNLATLTGNSANITGSATITSFGTVAAGTIVALAFNGATLTHNATSLHLPGNANIPTVAGDKGLFRSLGAGNWECLAFTKDDGTPVVTLPAEVQYFTKPLYAGEALSLGNALTHEYIWAGWQDTANYNIGDVTGNTKRSMSFLADGGAVTTIKLALQKVGAPTDNFTVRVETDSAGAPSGTLVHANATQTVAGTGLTTTKTDTSVTFTSFTPAAGTKCWLVLGRSNGSVDASNYYQVGGQAITTRAFPNKTYNGSVWAAADLTFTLYVGQTSKLISQPVLVQASALIPKFADVKGFAAAGYAYGVTAKALAHGQIPNFTSLVNGSEYFLSDTYGAISTTAGTNYSPVGVAVSPTSIDTGEGLGVKKKQFDLFNQTGGTATTLFTGGAVTGVNNYVSAADYFKFATYTMAQDFIAQLTVNLTSTTGNLLQFSAKAYLNGVLLNTINGSYASGPSAYNLAANFGTLRLKKGDKISVWGKVIQAQYPVNNELCNLSSTLLQCALPTYAS